MTVLTRRETTTPRTHYAAHAVNPKRDLSGFAPAGELPSPPAPPVPSRSPAVQDRPPTATMPPPQRSKPRAQPAAPSPSASPARSGRQRICVSLTAQTSELLTSLSEQRGCWKVQLIVEALHRWESDLRSKPAEATRFRRRRTSTLAPFVMDLTVPELKKLDALALAAGYSRSALVRQLIVAEGELAPSATL